MELRYTLIDPTKNITLLVTSPVPRSLQAQTANFLLKRHPEAEQVGFREAPEDPEIAQARLQMMGGEFCGNAAMSLGAWLSRENRLPWGEQHQWQLEVSGASEPVECTVTAVSGGYLGEVAMPLPEEISTQMFPLHGEAALLETVHLPGICHILLPAAMIDCDEAEALLRQWSAALPEAAVGLLLWEEEACRFTPLVYVKATDTAIWEQGCASGTAAVAAALTCRRRSGQCLSVRQPGGTIAAVTGYEGGQLTSLHIHGTVTMGRNFRTALEL